MPKHYEKIGLPQRLYQTLCRLTGETAPHLVVAVSGGKDSMALLYALSEEARQKGCTLRAIHIDHGLRKQSRYEAMLVEKACRAWKIPLIVEHLQVNANRMKGESIEMAARRLRYQALEWQREPEEWIVTAHHQNDVAETVLMHAIQGTGLRGLQGIPAKNGRIVRPMLAVSHEEIRCYIDACKIAHCEDQSNADPAYLRNRIRNTLLPLLCRAYNPQVVRALARLAEYAAEEEAYFAPIVENLEKKAKVGEEKELGAWYDKDVLCAAPPPVLSRWAGLTLVKLGIRTEERMVRTLMRLTRERGVCELAQGWRVKSGRFLEIFRSNVCRMAGQFAQGCTKIGPWRIEVIPAERPEQYPSKQARIQYFDEDEIRWPCTARMRKPGDKIAMPYGQKSISDLFTDEKTPMALRDHFPIIECDGQILWAVGVARSRLAKITNQTKRMIAMRFTYTLEEEQPC